MAWEVHIEFNEHHNALRLWITRIDSWIGTRSPWRIFGTMRVRIPVKPKNPRHHNRRLPWWIPCRRSWPRIPLDFLLAFKMAESTMAQRSHEEEFPMEFLTRDVSEGRSWEYCRKGVYWGDVAQSKRRRIESRRTIWAVLNSISSSRTNTADSQQKIRQYVITQHNLTKVLEESTFNNRKQSWGDERYECSRGFSISVDWRRRWKEWWSDEITVSKSDPRGRGISSNSRFTKMREDKRELNRKT
jgi:hypothetical protein